MDYLHFGMKMEKKWKEGNYSKGDSIHRMGLLG